MHELRRGAYQLTAELTGFSAPESGQAQNKPNEVLVTANRIPKVENFELVIPVPRCSFKDSSSGKIYI